MPNHRKWFPPTTGTKVNSWEVIGESTKPFHVLCRCKCGVERNIRINDLMEERSRSCTSCSSAAAKTKHGQHGSLTYVSWAAMIQRCTNPNFHKYPEYGGRGITVCEQWKIFENFLKDMGERPSKEYSIDRINNEGNYEPSNCRWATASQQAYNRRPKRVRS